MSTTINTNQTFWLIDDGRDLESLLSRAKRFKSLGAASAERKQGEGLIKATETTAQQKRGFV